MADFKGSIKIDSEVFEQIVDEQARLRKVEGKKPSYSDVIARYIRAATESPRAPIHAVQPGSDPAITPKTDYERRLVAAVILFLEQERDSPTLIGLLEKLLEDQLAQVGSKQGSNPTKRPA